MITRKHTILLGIAMMLSSALLSQTALIAGLNEKIEISSDATGRLMLEKRQEEGMIAREDRLFIEKDGQTSVIFESEGRAIEQILQADFDGNGSNEILIIMELGGSADYRELSLLQLKESKYQQIWTETGFSAGKIAINAKAGSSPTIVIDYFTEDTPPKEARAIYGFDGGKILLLKTVPPDKAG